ncbi:MAG: cytochrome c [Deltaproteobacteria bacterium]|nr:cytochrome c [Deltaproteobacteria bacterium]
MIVLSIGLGLLSRSAAAEPPAKQPPNVVQVEMQALVAALQTAVASIGAGDVREVAHTLHRVHEARNATEKALHSGAYKPPQNAAKLADFAKLDTAFHHELERMVGASGKNDVQGTAVALGAALGQCQGCHALFKDKPVAKSP